jgi:signal transduction histidine kinase
MEQRLNPFSLKKHNFHKAVKENATTVQDTADKKIIETVINESLEIHADYDILQSVIQNILSKTIKFTPRKGTISIQAKGEATGTIISIFDTRIGMNTKMLEIIFS